MKWTKLFSYKMREKKGSSMLEYGIGLLIFMLLFVFTFDLFTVANKRFQVGQQTSNIVRNIAIQGGVMPIVPAGFPGGNRVYLTSSELYNGINDIMNNRLDISEGHWDAIIRVYNRDGQVIREDVLSPRTRIQADYMYNLELEIRAEYNWRFLSMLIGDNLINGAEVRAVRLAMSEFKYDFDNWEGER